MTLILNFGHIYHGTSERIIIMDYLEVGKIINTHGLRGEVKVVSWTDFPEDFEKLDYVIAKKRSENERLNIQNIKYQKNNLILKLEGIDTIEQAELYKNAVLTVPKDALGDLPEGVYYIVDLIGCTVFDNNNNTIGILADVFSTGSNDVYDIKRDGKKNLYVPIIDGVVEDVDIDNKKITINIPEGLEDD